MNVITVADREFERKFLSGELSPRDFDHRAHLRLAYVLLASRDPVDATLTFRESLLGFLRHHHIDAGKFHETLTQAWLQAVRHFMHRFPDTVGSEDFLQKCTLLHDPQVMLTHYTRETLYSEEARRHFIAPDLKPIPLYA